MSRERRSLRRYPIRYGDPQGWKGKGEGLLPFYHSLIQRRTFSEKTLFLGDSDAAYEVASMQPKFSDAKITDFPAMAALCFALAEIDIDPIDDAAGDRSYGTGPADPIGGY